MHHALGSAGYLESRTFLGTAPSSVPGAGSAGFSMIRRISIRTHAVPAGLLDKGSVFW